MQKIEMRQCQIAHVITADQQTLQERTDPGGRADDISLDIDLSQTALRTGKRIARDGPDQ